jgi:hypothetical protein
MASASPFQRAVSATVKACYLPNCESAVAVIASRNRSVLTSIDELSLPEENDPVYLAGYIA